MTQCNARMSAAPVWEHVSAGSLDRLGIVASLACVVHCLAAPLLLLFLPVLGAWWSHPAAHWVLAALVLPLAGIVIVRGYRKHRRRIAVVALALGMVFIVAGLVLPHVDGAQGFSLRVSSAEAQALDPELSSSLLVLDQADPGAAGDGCTETCCPSVAIDAETGQATGMAFPPGSLATFWGSVFLVLAHAVNLHGCVCLTRSAKAAADGCGCVDA